MTGEPRRRQALQGSEPAVPEVRRLRAGDLSVELEEGDLRYVRAGGLEVVRRIYASVRDVNWNTIGGEMRALSIEERPDAFRATFEARHRGSGIDFEWTATIDGSADGVVRYALEGRARAAFRYCRVGFCMLHPISTTAGRPYRAVTPKGPVAGVFPTLVAPQPFVDRVYLPLFPSFDGLTVDLGSGRSLTCEFEGDLFEIEDQRNWTDGSFKTYCTPASLGFPFAADAGQRFFQRITLRVTPAASGTDLAPAAGTIETGGARLDIGGVLGAMPAVGFGRSSVLPSLGPREVELVRTLRPAHLRADLRLGEPGWERELELASRDAEAVGTSLELAIFATDDAPAQLARLAGQIASRPVARYLVFHEREANDTTTSASWVTLARQHLAAATPGATFVGGTNGNFAEVNRDRPEAGMYDGVCYPINPQVHASDGRSMVEAIDAQADTVRTARAFFGGGPVVVSAVTLKPPFNQAASEEEAPVAPGELPPQVDPRQPSMFAACWTVGSLRALATSGASAVTYYETAGWRGLFETTRGSRLPDRFRSVPGAVFPVYGVFAALADARDAEVLECRSTRPLAVDGLALRVHGRVRLLVANLTAEACAALLTGLPRVAVSVRRLRDPEEAAAFAAQLPPVEVMPVEGGRLDLELGPFEVARVDEAEPGADPG